MHYPLNWNLNSFFPNYNPIPDVTQKLAIGPRQNPAIEIAEEGGSIEEIQPPSSATQSREFSRGSNGQLLSHVGYTSALKDVREKIAALKKRAATQDFPSYFEALQELDAQIRELDSFVLCLESQNVEDPLPLAWRAEISQYTSDLEQLNQSFDRDLSALTDSAFHTLLKTPEWTPLAFLFQERKERVQMQLPLAQEQLISSLSVDGYHGWGDFYPQLVAEVKIPSTTTLLSVGQAENLLTHPDRAVREQVFTAFENSWEQKKHLFASILNHISGFRLQTLSRRGIADPLQEPLFEYRMRKETLEALWAAVDANKTPFLDFLSLRASQLNVERLAWFDLDAPMEEGPQDPIPYEDAAAQVIAHFHHYHPGMGAFAEKACRNGWIEAEDRPGKRPGGFCTSFPKTKTSRIFMTYSGTLENVSTLAHELGHAYHSEQVENLPSFAQHYPMNIAETASTFAEHLLQESLLQNAKNPEEKRKLLGDRIQRSAKYFLNIHARFLFETTFYERRKGSYVSAEELCALMQEAQAKAYKNSLSQYHPYFWASKLHFYFTKIPFYNFPYTFGYLFSLGLFTRAKQEGKAFMRTYDLLLKESGLMSIEDLAATHLGVDLSQPSFWQEAMATATRDVEAYLELHSLNRIK